MARQTAKWQRSLQYKCRISGGMARNICHSNQKKRDRSEPKSRVRAAAASPPPTSPARISPNSLLKNLVALEKSAAFGG